MTAATERLPAGRPGARDRVAGLDGLRALAVGLVLVEHLPKVAVPPPLLAFAEAISAGYLGVDLFFVLSGFLITRILLADRREGVPVRWFLARRALRILPAFYLLVAVVAVAAPIPALPWVATYTVNYWSALTGGTTDFLMHTWSLAVEEHFYLLWPLLVAFCSVDRSRRVATLLLLPGCLLVSLWLDLRVGGRTGTQLLYYGTQSRALSLLAGAMLAFHEPALRGATRALDAAIAATVIVVPLGAWFVVRTWPSTWNLVRYVGWMLWCTAVVAGCVRSHVRGGALARALEWWPLRHVGQRSYGVYLYHLPVFALVGHQVLRAELAPHFWQALAGVAATLLAAELSWLCWEQPFLRLKRRFQAAA